MTTSPTPGRRVFVVADDLTGANDTGVQFAQAGWSSMLRLGRGGPVPIGPGTAVAISTDARAVGDEEAARRTAAALAETGPSDVVYVKVDSTMRGSVAGQLDGALAARRAEDPDAFVLLCPAYPRMGRTVEGGTLLVGGVPVSASPAGTDPVTPVHADRMTDLVPGCATVPVVLRPDRLISAIEEAARHADVIAVDARDDDDLDRIAEAVLTLGPRATVAGSAGLARPLARRWRGRSSPVTATPTWDVRRPLVVVSSHHAVARRQVEVAATDLTNDLIAPVTVVEATLEGLLTDERLPHVDPAHTLVLLTPGRRADASVAESVARALARRTRTLIEGPASFDALVLVGGDGAEAVLGTLDARGIRIDGQLLEGVPVGQVVGGIADGLPVVTKAGGFGSDRTLVDLLTTLHTPTGTETSR